MKTFFSLVIIGAFLSIKQVASQTAIQLPFTSVLFYRFLSSMGVQKGKVLVK